jgi:histidinol-phosphatase (PHP family)
VLDYHLHLWPHDESSVWYRLDQIAAYCDEAATHGVTELALTEHAHRFRDVTSVVGRFWEKLGHEPTSQVMADYVDWHARNALDDYVTLAQRAKDEGLPVKIGLEVDYCPGRMADLSELFAQYPFDVLIGSVHWLGTWGFDDLSNAHVQAVWQTSDVDEVWARYTQALDELAQSRSVDVLAHPDLAKVAGYVPADPTPFWDEMAASAARANVSIECSSAGWKKPIQEQYPAAGLLDRYVAAGVTFTTASDAHQRERVGERSDDLAALLEARGVTSLAGYDQRQRVMMPLRSE